MTIAVNFTTLARNVLLKVHHSSIFKKCVLIIINRKLICLDLKVIYSERK